MPGERLSMRKVREVLRLKYACGASVRTIARSVGIGRTTVAEYLRRTSVVGITWPVPAEIDDAELEHRLFASPVRDVIVAMLEAQGFEALPASGGPSMREILAGARGAKIDAIVLDIVMPGEQGATLALHAKDLNVPVVMISGNPHAMQFAYEGHLQLLEKPFSMPMLIAAVRKAITSGEFGQRDTIA